MQLDERLSVIEAILFASGEPVEFDRLCACAGAELSELHALVGLLNDSYSDNGSALEVLRLENCYQLAAKKEYAPYIKSAMETKKSAALSSAAMETLTIIAYNQPVTRSFIDDIRGVDSSGVVTSLLEKELIKEAGRLDIPGKPVLFATTENFLRCFGLSSIQELPPLPGDDDQISFDELRSDAAE